MDWTGVPRVGVEGVCGTWEQVPGVVVGPERDRSN